MMLPVLMFIIACVVRDIETMEEALQVLMFFPVLAMPLLVTYWILAKLQVGRKEVLLKTSIWYSALISILVTGIFAGYAIYTGFSSTQISIGSSIIFLLMWLVHLTGSVIQYLQMTAEKHGPQ